MARRSASESCHGCCTVTQAFECRALWYRRLAQRAQADLEVDLKALLEECLAKLEPKFGKGNVSTEFLQGDPKVGDQRCCVEMGRGHDRHGLTQQRPREFMAGSATLAVVLSAPCTVQVLNAESAWSAKKKESENAPDESSRYVVAVGNEADAELIIDDILAHRGLLKVASR